MTLRAKLSDIEPMSSRPHSVILGRGGLAHLVRAHGGKDEISVANASNCGALANARSGKRELVANG